MPTQKIFSVLPTIYTQFLPSFFEQKIPQESFATCHDCAMVCHNPGKANQPANSFLADVKCCSFYPGLPSYLVGGLLQNSSADIKEGRARIQAIINKRIGVSPLGIQPPPKYSLLYTRTEDGFGRTHSLLCPYYQRETGLCTIWQYREAVCSTFFCKTVAAEAGKAFWKALKTYLLFVQRQLCTHILVQLNFSRAQTLLNDFNFGPKSIQMIRVADLDGLPPTDKRYQEVWQSWVGREEEFFIMAHRLIRNLVPAEFEAIMGVKHKILLAELKETWDNMVTLPSKLMKNPTVSLQPGHLDSYLIHYDSIDAAFELPMIVLDAFDGQETTEGVREKLQKSHDIEVEPEYILSLYQHQILVKQEAHGLPSPVLKQ